MKRLFLSLVLVVITLCRLFAVDVPSFNNYVNDHGKVLTENELSGLNKNLKAFDDSTSTQIAVLTVPSYNDREDGPLVDFCHKVFTSWGVGQKNKNNGVLLVIVKHLASKNGPGIRIYTGYGLEGALPDAICRRIIEENIRPAINSSRYYEGISSGVERIKSYVKDEYLAKDKIKKTIKDIPEIVLFIIIFFVIIILFIIIRSLALSGVSDYSSSSSSSYYPDFSSGDSDSSGGGFDGFGGGGGGGGGAGD